MAGPLKNVLYYLLSWSLSEHKNCISLNMVGERKQVQTFSLNCSWALIFREDCLFLGWAREDGWPSLLPLAALLPG